MFNTSSSQNHSHEDSTLNPKPITHQVHDEERSEHHEQGKEPASRSTAAGQFHAFRAFIMHMHTHMRHSPRAITRQYTLPIVRHNNSNLTPPSPTSTRVPAASSEAVLIRHALQQPCLMKVRDLQKAWIVFVSFCRGSQAVCFVFLCVGWSRCGKRGDKAGSEEQALKTAPRFAMQLSVMSSSEAHISISKAAR